MFCRLKTSYKSLVACEFQVRLGAPTLPLSKKFSQCSWHLFRAFFLVIHFLQLNKFGVIVKNKIANPIISCQSYKLQNVDNFSKKSFTSTRKPDEEPFHCVESWQIQTSAPRLFCYLIRRALLDILVLLRLVKSSAVVTQLRGLVFHSSSIETKLLVVPSKRRRCTVTFSLLIK